VTELEQFRVVYEEEASEFVVAQTKRRRRKLLDIGYAIAEKPLADPDYVLPDADGRPICHVETEGYVFCYWVDAPVKRIVIVGIERGE
jgi:hypothetical protein